MLEVMVPGAHGPRSEHWGDSNHKVPVVKFASIFFVVLTYSEFGVRRVEECKNSRKSHTLYFTYHLHKYHSKFLWLLTFTRKKKYSWSQYEPHFLSHHRNSGVHVLTFEIHNKYKVIHKEIRHLERNVTWRWYWDILKVCMERVIQKVLFQWTFWTHHSTCQWPYETSLDSPFTTWHVVTTCSAVQVKSSLIIIDQSINKIIVLHTVLYIYTKLFPETFGTV